MKKVWVTGLALAMLWVGPALAQRTDIVVGLILEPPHLDPTAGAAAAIDEVVYANVFEVDQFGPDGDLPALAGLGHFEDALTYTFRHEASSSMTARRWPMMWCFRAP